MTVFEAKNRIAAALLPIAGEDAFTEASFLLQSRGLSSPFDAVSDADRAALQPLIERRLQGEPLQYVLGEWSFYGLDFTVTPDVLIPRPDTECLVETALSMRKDGPCDVLDLCCGSGCIGVVLAKRGANVTAADISDRALEIARRNAERNGVTMKLVESDLFENVTGTFDLIVSNPPYLSDADMAAMDAGLRFEPALALYGGADGLDFYRRIAADYKRYLKPGGALLLEIGMTQKEAVSAFFRNSECITDYGGRPRVITVRNDD